MPSFARIVRFYNRRRNAEEEASELIKVHEPKSKKSKKVSTHKPVRKVRFSPSVHGRNIDSHRSYTEEERANTWYSKTETKEMRKQSQMLVLAFSLGLQISSCDSIRGLELRLPGNQKLRQLRKMNAMQKVLAEQIHADYEDLPVDHIAIAKIYASMTAPSQADARRMGKEDAKDAGLYP